MPALAGFKTEEDKGDEDELKEGAEEELIAWDGLLSKCNKQQAAHLHAINATTMFLLNLLFLSHGWHYIRLQKRNGDASQHSFHRSL